MPIVGFNFDKILVEKTNPISGGVQVKNNMSIKNVEEQELFLGKKKENVLKFSFEFSSTYEPKIGLVSINGHILFMEDPSEIKKIMDSWKKKKSVPQTLMSHLLNTVLMRCNVKTLILSSDVNLPPHIRLPTISPKAKASEYIG
ncbi:MAG: hypothetical protein ISS23_03670 [Nanoarchaeota archaeon]|nr:hypothetical protein [Nanoarchaeota archaeon]